MVDNAPSVGIVRCSKNPVDAREKNIQQRAKSISLAGAVEYVEMGKVNTRLTVLAEGATFRRFYPALSFYQTWRSEEEGSDITKVITFVIF